MDDTAKSKVLSDLTEILGDGLSLPESARYKQSNGSYFSAFENELKPLCIAEPSNVGQVQKLIKALAPHGGPGPCDFAIRGAGHTPFRGSANINDGVTVDLRRLKGIALSEDKSIVEIRVGETWATVYAELEKDGLTVPGGRVGRIGVAGFILGGGLSMFSSRLGFACDSVSEFEIVLASGEIARANDEHNADLYWGLKGGLNNFGIVTSFKMRTIKSSKIWGGVTFYPPETFPQLLERTCDFVENETDEDTHIMCSAGYGFGQQGASFVMYHTRGEENPPSLQRFTSLESQVANTRRTATQLEFSDELSKFSQDGVRQYWASITIHSNLELMKKFYEEWEKTLSQIKDVAGLVFSFGFHPLTKSLLSHSSKAGGNPAAISPSDGPLFVVLINPIWTLQKDDERIFTAVGTFVSNLRLLAKNEGALHRYIFTNYGFGHDDVLAGYGEESIAKLRAISKRVDPHGLFQKGVPGGFKLPKMESKSTVQD